MSLGYEVLAEFALGFSAGGLFGYYLGRKYKRLFRGWFGMDR